MNRIKTITLNIFKATGIFLLFILFILGSIALLPAKTPKIITNNKKSIAKIDYITLGGTEQCVLIRTENKDNPILLFLHGGPGMPMMYLAHDFQRRLEKNFTVVQWDRRGAGKSYVRKIPSTESMTDRQLINDGYDLIDTLKKRFNQDKIILIGHSFGSYLGSIMVYERPELFNAYVSIGQVVDSRRARPIQREFVKKMAIKHHKNEILEALNTSEHINLENWLFKFGGELKHSTSFTPLLMSGLRAPEYTLKDAFNVGKGSSFSSKHMKYEMIENSIYEDIKIYKVPVYFIEGRFDYTTPHELVYEYYNMIEAPQKKFYYFEESAHFPFFEEPEKFSTIINEIHQHLILSEHI